VKVSEVFYSIQGEGARVGDASVFVRLTGCNLACGFCDTEFESGVEMSSAELLTEIGKAVERACPKVDLGELLGPATEDKWIVWTGGEPTDQLTPEIVDWFKSRGWSQAIETNGTRPVPEGIDWICCSPKVAEHVLAKNFPRGVDELRYVRHAGQPGVPVPSVRAKSYFLSPLFDGNVPNRDNLRHCLDLCLRNPTWCLSLQLHKLLKVL